MEYTSIRAIHKPAHHSDWACQESCMGHLISSYPFLGNMMLWEPKLNEYISMLMGLCVVVGSLCCVQCGGGREQS